MDGSIGKRARMMFVRIKKESVLNEGSNKYFYEYTVKNDRVGLLMHEGYGKVFYECRGTEEMDHDEDGEFRMEPTEDEATFLKTLPGESHHSGLRRSIKKRRYCKRVCRLVDPATNLDLCSDEHEEALV
ncbi:hypothetical protein J0A71_06g12960 [Encephalitozoon cuniculi]|nr:hypothetical protein J0A71_06g12960 [Encephalitozoon cuniculi]